ncbi:MAG: hypothetical protein ACM3H8_13975, partial [Sphingobacteriales bacterium]
FINDNLKLSLLKKNLGITATLIFLYACQKNPDLGSVDCSGPAKSFVTNVSPVIQASCATDSDCHGTGSSSGPGPLLNYTQVFNARSDIRSSVASGHMPLNGTLTATERNAILCWIDNGATNN